MSVYPTPAHPARSTVLGYPRIGRDRELKHATEAYWRSEIPADELLAVAARLRRENWLTLHEAGIEEVPCNDFSLYDQVLDTALMVGAVPARHRVPDTAPDAALRTYFAMARGTDTVPPLEMTKWFDTNYHYLVPELGPDTVFRLDATKPMGELAEARALGLAARPVLVGPVTFLLLAKPAVGAFVGFDPLALLDRLVEVYAELLGLLQDGGAAWVQFDEPVLACDQPPAVLEAVARAYRRLGGLTRRPRLLVAAYFDSVGESLKVLRDAPIEGVALDFTGPAAANLEQLAAVGGLPGKRLVAGVVDGRNVWINDLRASLSTLGTLLGLAGHVTVAPSCSLLHVPIDLGLEQGIDPQVRRWLAFARQKADEVVTLARGLAGGPGAIRAQLAANDADLAARAASALTRDEAVRRRMAAVVPDDRRRRSPYDQRAPLQRKRLGLPPLPTTTIGSFPQTRELRAARAGLRTGRLGRQEYRERIAREIAHVVRLQEDAGLDVLVHGEAERNDMVQFFAERLAGFLATQHGWVQSYGTRYVRPPVLAGDVSRPAAMTVDWTCYAQSLTDRPVKGMLTGPVTMLCWSFVRDDQPIGETAGQVALALRDEVNDLEAAGASIIQVDEPALREGLPLRRAAWPAYLRWAVEAFRLATGGVHDETQIHTHMCYAEFGDILPAIADLDADVISLEAARSRMGIAAELAHAGYPAAVGPGVYDMHSPRVPGTEEIVTLLEQALTHLPVDRVWVNPDCGLKTRAESEVVPALANMVAAARLLRARPDLPAEAG